MPDFLESPRFPGCPRLGLVSDPEYSVTPVRTAGGWETRNLNWAQPLTRVTITVGPGDRLADDIQELLEFWHAVGGSAMGFRYKDWSDYKSCRIGNTPSQHDQPLVWIAGDTYQLTKRYTAGAQSRDRAIRKPVAGTILIDDDGVLKTETTDYTVDYTTGIVTLNFTPVSTGDLTWGGEYDIPVRFDSGFPVEQLLRTMQSVSFTLQEIRV
jgi:uncharacterized protein (TIGR02217 family)